MDNKNENNFRQLLFKAERFCGYRERCSFEVRQKMKELHADEEIISKIISSLHEDNFLNDERFARLFASGKFRIKRWGKNKIRAELRMKKITDAFIYNALDAIDADEYKKTMEHLAQKKAREIKSKKSKDKTQKIAMYLLSKGYESELVWQVLKADASLFSD